MENDKLRYESDVKNQGKYLRNSKTEFDLLCSMSVKMQESFASTADEFNKLTREYHDSVDTIGKLSKKCDDLNRDIERMEEHSANQSEELYRLRATANNTTSSLQKATHQIEQRKAREERLEANIKELTEQLNREMNKSAGIYKLLAETEGKAAAAMESAASSQSYAEETLKR
jgi:chromosome segregation ATPase